MNSTEWRNSDEYKRIVAAEKERVEALKKRELRRIIREFFQSILGTCLLILILHFLFG